MIRLIVMDVDGTLTDGSIYYNEAGVETKKFQAKDGAGIVIAQAAGKDCIILTGRESFAVKRRAEDLHIKYVFQGVRDKKKFLTDFVLENGIKKEELLYIGDDLNDLPAMSIAGKVGCPADAVDEIKDIADYISSYNGGYGAVRDIITRVLKEEGIYQSAILNAYGEVGV